MGEKSDSESKWLARICVAAFLVWMPLELLRGIIPAASIYDVIKDPAFANLATALGAAGTVLAIVGTAAVARMQIQAATEAEDRRKHEMRRIFVLHVIQIVGICQHAERRFNATKLDARFLIDTFPSGDLERGLEKLDNIINAQITDVFVHSVGETVRAMLADVVTASAKVSAAYRAGAGITLHAHELHHSIKTLVGWYDQSQRLMTIMAGD